MSRLNRIGKPRDLTASYMPLPTHLRAIVNACYSPPEDGAQSLIHAATVDWEKERCKGKDGKAVAPSEDLRYYARGLFTSTMICNLQGLRGKQYSFMQNVEGTIWGIARCDVDMGVGGRGSRLSEGKFFNVFSSLDD